MVCLLTPSMHSRTLWSHLRCMLSQAAYTEDIDSIFTHHGVHHHAFADDTQTYLAVTRHNARTVAPRLQNCLRDISDFCGSRRLQLNENKTEIMRFGSSASLCGLTATEKKLLSSVTLMSSPSTPYATESTGWTLALPMTTVFFR